MIAEYTTTVKDLLIEVCKNHICLAGVILIVVGCIGAFIEMLRGG